MKGKKRDYAEALTSILASVVLTVVLIRRYPKWYIALIPILGLVAGISKLLVLSREKSDDEDDRT